MENLIELGREIFRKYYKIPYNLLCHSCHDSIFLFLLLCSLPSIFIGFSSSPWLYHPCKSIRLPNSYLWLWLLSLTLGPSVQKLPWWLSGKESTCNAEDRGSIPGLERSLRGGHGNPLQYSCLENPMDRGAWQGTVHRVANSQAWLSD